MKEKLIRIVSLAVKLKEKGILCSVDYSPKQDSITIYMFDNDHHILDMLIYSNNSRINETKLFVSFGYMVDYLEGLLEGEEC